MKDRKQAWLLLCAAMGVAAVLGACNVGFSGLAGPTSVDSSRKQQRANVTVDAAGVKHVSGETGPGALYELAVPPVWNGDLVL